jgi:hypothetical protein
MTNAQSISFLRDFAANRIPISLSGIAPHTVELIPQTKKIWIYSFLLKERAKRKTTPITKTMMNAPVYTPAPKMSLIA